MWSNMTTRRMYVSGGVGSRYQGEAFGDDYELPNGRAYTETCAAIAVVMWAWRMLALDGDARYADVLERALYNGVLAGLSLDGLGYFYVNPLASDPEATLRDGTRGRQPWFNCACCPPNIARLLASLPGYFYSVSQDAIWCHLYGAGDARITLGDGRSVTLKQVTHYPWDGDVTVHVAGAGEFALRMRIPGWCEAQHGVSLTVNGSSQPHPLAAGSYAEVRRTWQPGDVVGLRLPMAAQRVESHPHALENAGRAALMRGPMLYCVEGVDHAGLELLDLVLPRSVQLDAVEQPELLGGVVTLRARGELRAPDDGWRGRLYRPAGQAALTPSRGVDLAAIPYYAWANREPGAMQVWLREE
jgi:hypothetical protein